MKKSVGKLTLVLAAVIFVLYLAGSWFFSGLIIHGPRRDLATEQQRYGSPADYGLPAPEEIELESAGVTLKGWYFDLPGNTCGAALFHGHSSSRYGAMHYSQLFQAYNCDLVMIDFRNHGASGGEAGSFGAHERQDVLAALDYLQQRTGLADGQLALVGVSYGGSAIIHAAAQRPGLAFVLADSTFRSLPAIITVQGVTQYGPAVQLMVPGALALSGLRAGFNPWDVNPESYAGRLEMPVFLLHEVEDGYTPAEHSQAIYDNIPHTHKTLHLVRWSNQHSRSLQENPAGYQAYFDEFIGQYAPQFGKP